MAEQDSQFTFDAETELLRKTLEQLRQEAEAEIDRLRARLAEHGPLDNQQVATATQQLALEQEMLAVQKALAAKEEALEQITAECRRLEDVLEDRRLELERLQKELNLKDQALKESRLEIERLKRALADLATTPAVETPRPTVIYETRTPGWLKALTASLTLLLAVSGAGNVYLMQQGLDRGNLSPAPQPLPLPPPIAQAGGVGGGSALAAPTAQQRRIHRDRLSDGTPAPTMVMLAGGTFQMGAISTTGEDFSPPRLVSVRPFMIGAHEITFIEYDRFARATGRPLPPDPGWGRERHPVVGITWDEASDYAAWLAQQTGRRYRLPSEAEWEYAARGGTTTPFWWGTEVGVNRAVCFDCGSPWDNRSTAPVMSLAANPFGLYEIHGNAMEWVADCYQPNYQGAPNDGSPLLAGDCSRRVARGGAFNKPAASMRAFARAAYPPDSRLNMLGFRVACDP